MKSLFSSRRKASTPSLVGAQSPLQNFTYIIRRDERGELTASDVAELETISLKFFHNFKQKKSLWEEALTKNQDVSRILSAEHAFVKKILSSNTGKTIECAADAILTIIHTYKLHEKEFYASVDPNDWARGYIPLIQIASFIDRYVDITTTEEQRLSNAKRAFFIKILKEPAIRNQTKKWNNLLEFEQMLGITATTTAAEITAKASSTPEENNFKRFFPYAAQNITGDMKAITAIHTRFFLMASFEIANINWLEPYYEQIKNQLMTWGLEEEAILLVKQYLPESNNNDKEKNVEKYIVDAIYVMIYENNLLPFLEKPKTINDLLGQCINLIGIAQKIDKRNGINKESKTLMMQLLLQLPDGLKLLKSKTDKNLQDALEVVKNRGSKTEFELKRDIKFIGNKNEKKQFLYDHGITEVRSAHVDHLHMIYSKNDKVIDAYLQTKKAKRCMPAQITEDLVIAYTAALCAAKDKPELVFELYLNYKDDAEYLRAIDKPEKVAQDRAKLTFQDGIFYCQALLIQHYLPANLVLNKINLGNKGSNPSVFELAQCLANLNTRAQRETVVAYYNEFGSTTSFNHLYNAATAIKRDATQLAELQRNQLYDFLITKMKTGDLKLNTEEPDITDLCIYYNKANMHSTIGSDLVEKREQEEATTYANISEKLDGLFKNKPAFDKYRDELVYIYSYYQDNKDSLKFIENYIKDNIQTDQDLDIFMTRIRSAHQRVMSSHEKSLLKLEFYAPNASPYVKIISNLDEKSYNFYERVMYAQQFADAHNNNQNEYFKFAFNHPDIAAQCTNIDMLSEIMDIETQGHDKMQLEIFKLSLQEIDEEIDYNDDDIDNANDAAINNLINNVGSSSMRSRAPTVTNQRKKLDEKDIKKYVSAFYLIHFSQYDTATKNLLKAKLAILLKDAIKLTDIVAANLEKLTQSLNVEITNLININDDWSVISEEDAKIFSKVFGQEISNKADLIYSFYYFSNYPACKPLQFNLHIALKNYLQTKDRGIFLDTIIKSGLDKTSKYKAELTKLNKQQTIKDEVEKRVGDTAKRAELLIFFEKYPVLQKAIILKNPNWANMYSEISAFTNGQDTTAQDMEILVEIALLYPGLLMRLPVPAHLQAYKKLATEFSFVKDDVNKRDIIIKLCKNPNYKQQLLKELGLNRKFIGLHNLSKDRSITANDIRDKLLVIHFEYGHGLAAYFNRIKGDAIPFIYYHHNLNNVISATEKYLTVDDDTIPLYEKNKNESFLIHLHWLHFGGIREPMTKAFATTHRKFSDLKLNLPNEIHINIRNIIVELELYHPGHLMKFSQEIKSNPDMAIRNYTYLHELYRLKIYNAVRDVDFVKHPLFVIYKTIRDNNFLSDHEKNNLISVLVDNSKKYDEGFIKSIQLFGVYPLLLSGVKTALIKKYSKQLNGNVGLKDHKTLPYLKINHIELSSLASTGKKLTDIQVILRLKEKDAQQPVLNIEDAKEATDKFFESVFPQASKTLMIYNRLYEVELAIPGALNDIYNEFATDIDSVLSPNEYNASTKLTWLSQLLDKIEFMIDSTVDSSKPEIRLLISKLGNTLRNDPDFLTSAQNDLLLNELSKKQKQDIAPILPGLLVAYSRYPAAIRSFIISDRVNFLENPCAFYNRSIQVADRLNQLGLSEIDHQLLTIIFKYPRLLDTIIHKPYHDHLMYALYKCSNDTISQNDDMAAQLLFSLQFLDNEAEVLKFIRFVKNQDPLPHIDQKLYHLAQYLLVIQRSNLSFEDKHTFCSKLTKGLMIEHAAFANFNDSMSNIAQLAGYDYQTSMISVKSENVIESLDGKLKAVAEGADGNYKNLAFPAAFNLSAATKTNDSLTLVAASKDFIKEYKAPTSVELIKNTVTVNAGCFYYLNPQLENEKYPLKFNATTNNNNFFDTTQILFSGTAMAHTQMIALLYEDFINEAFSQDKPGVNFLHLGCIEPSYNIIGLNKDWSKYYHMTTWQQENIAAATYAQIAHDSANIPNIYKGREKNKVLKLNAASQLFEDGLMLYSLMSPSVSPTVLYSFDGNKLINKVNLSKSEDRAYLNSILKYLLKYNDIKQFNHGICSQKNLKLIAKIFGCYYQVSRDNIATLMYRYQQRNIRSPFADQVYAQFSLFLRGEINEATLFAAIKKCSEFPAVNPEAQDKFLKYMNGLSRGDAVTNAPALSTNRNPNAPLQQMQLNSSSNFVNNFGLFN